jgi:hypothetical protein
VFHRLIPLVSACLVLAMTAGAAEQIERVSPDPDGTIHIVLAGGKQTTIARQKDQVGTDDIQIASDHSAAGWTELYPNCCTSYPIPLNIAVYRDGRVRRRFKSGLMIYKWQFWKGGKQIAFCSGTVHGDQGVTCELHDVASGHNLASFERMPTEHSPDWAQGLRR